VEKMIAHCRELALAWQFSAGCYGIALGRSLDS